MFPAESKSLHPQSASGFAQQIVIFMFLFLHWIVMSFVVFRVFQSEKQLKGNATNKHNKHKQTQMLLAKSESLPPVGFCIVKRVLVLFLFYCYISSIYIYIYIFGVSLHFYRVPLVFICFSSENR